MSVEDISIEQLESAIKTFVSIESATQISRRYVRKKLEEIFNLEENSLYQRKKEINEIVGRVLTNLLEEENKEKNNEIHVKKEVLDSVVTNSEKKKNNIDSQANYIYNSECRTKDEIRNENDENNKSVSSQSDSNDKSLSKKRKKVGNEMVSVRKKQANVMTKDFFLKNAKTLLCNLSDNIKLKLEPRTFSTGSCGWHIMDKIFLLVGDHNVLCQICINCSVIGSKQWN